MVDHWIPVLSHILRSGERSFARGGIGANFVYNGLVFKKVPCYGRDELGGQLLVIPMDQQNRSCLFVLQ